MTTTTTETPASVAPPAAHKTYEELSFELSSRRTGLSLQRTRMSADRTLMSTIRTAISLIGFGFTIFQFLRYVATSMGIKGELPHHEAPQRSARLATAIRVPATCRDGSCPQPSRLLVLSGKPASRRRSSVVRELTAAQRGPGPFREEAMSHRMLTCIVTIGIAAAAALSLPACSREPAPPATAEAPATQAPAEPAAAPQTTGPEASRPGARPKPVSPSQGPAATGAAPAPAPAPEPPPPPPPPPPRRYTFAADMPIGIYTTSTLSTKANKSGEPFRATLAQAVRVGDWVIAKEGATVEGVIVESDPGGKVKGVASLSVALRSLRLADGRTIDLATNTITQEAKTSKGKDAKKIGIGAGVGAAIGAIAGGGKGAAIGAAVGGGAGTAASLATHGEPATLPSESLLTFVLTSPVTVVEKR
jgi:hypothetical protein